MVDIVLPLLATALVAAGVYTLVVHRGEYLARRKEWREQERRLREKQRAVLLPLSVDVLLVVATVAVLLGVFLANLPSEDAQDAGRWCLGAGIAGLVVASGVAFVVERLGAGRHGSPQ